MRIYAQGNELFSESEQQLSDTVSTTLDEIEIVVAGRSVVGKGGSMSLDSRELIEGIRVMGEADPVNMLKKLSGVKTSGDYGSGIQIDGFESSQSLFRINKVPIFFPYRFGGLFSAFSTPYFDRIDFERGFHTASMPDRLGAKIDFYSANNVSQQFNGNVNIGMLASSVALRCPVGPKFQFSISGRISYVDQLYGSFFRGPTNLNYNFSDLNAGFLWQIDDKNILGFESFFNSDRLKYSDVNYAMTTLLNWSNQMASLTWTHKKTSGDLNNRIYYSGFDNRLSLELPQFSLATPSSVSLLGIAGDFSQWLRDNSLYLDYGYEIDYYRNILQSVKLEGLDRGPQEESKPANSFETRIYGDLKLTSLRKLKISAGVSVSFFNEHSSYNTFNIDPRINISFPLWVGYLNLHLGRYSQYLHQVGISQIGLASDFWLTSSKSLPPQNSYNLELDFTGAFSIFSFSLTGYFRKIISEPDYFGQVLNLLENGYNVFDYIRLFNGYNCGLNFISKIVLHSINLSLGLGYGIARRYDRDIEKWIRGHTEPGFTVNADFSYKINDHWECGAQFRLASGRPYTPIVSMYVLAGNVIKEFGEPNSALFPINNQLDLSATWNCDSNFRKFKLKHLINLSIINAYGHKNVEIMNYVINPDNGEISLKKVYSLYRFLPSLSYTLEF